MENHSDFNKLSKVVFNFLLVLMLVVFSMAGGILYIMNNPNTTFFNTKKEDALVDGITVEVIDEDRIENGIHVTTGLKDAEGLMTVVQNCTGCHSAKLVTQNRMSRERWVETIRWMQRTQNLPDLGKNEDIILNYLVTNYPVEQKGRRENLKDIVWYELKE